MKKIICFLLAFFTVMSVLPLSSCTKNEETVYLNVYNWEEYISEEDEETGTVDLVSLFEEYASEVLGKNVVVNYSTFGTNENMYNELQLTKTKTKDGYKYNYDLVCPSDYMIQKMIKENMVEEFDLEVNSTNPTELKYSDALSNFNEYGSQYIKKLFIDNNWQKYAICYNWGTMGYTYNPEEVSEEDVKHWSLLWNEDYKHRGTIKDSVRDSYVLAVGKVYENELMQLRSMYENNELSLYSYQRLLIEVYNNIDTPLVDIFTAKQEDYNINGEALTKLNDVFSNYKNQNITTLSLVSEELKDVKNKIYGFEVDSGKKDMASGKLLINFAWSGDAVYTLDTAEEETGVLLKYAVPEEGSNIWFDGWVMPKGANKELAQMFVNFLCRPESAINNMTYIGYTSPIAGEEIKAWLSGYYEVDEDNNFVLDENDEKIWVDGYYDIATEQDEEYKNEIDLTYFFGDETKFYITDDDLNRQFTIQYPTKNITDRCAIMTYMPHDDLEKLNNMWISVKVGRIPLALIIIIPTLLFVFISIFVIYQLVKSNKFNFNKKVNGTLISSEKLN